MLVKMKAPARGGRSRPSRRPTYPIHALRHRLALAFTLPPSEPDPEAEAVTGVLRTLKASNAAALAGVRDALLAGRASPEAAATAFSDEADRCLARALSLALDSMQRRHGPAPGRCAVLGLGKLGGRELSFGSDLDLIFVFEREDQPYCPRAAAYFEEVARGLIGALCCHPQVGPLYEVDMRLRPHGGDGVLAVELAAFADYYRHDCWTWELQALTRARVIAGDEALGRRVLDIQGEVLAHRLGLSSPAILAEVAGMRALLDEEHPAATPWDVKRAAGGLVDIEFIAQGLQLGAGLETALSPQASTPRALEQLAACGALAAEDAAQLIRAWSLQFLILQYQRALGVEPRALAAQPPARLAPLLRAAKAASLGALNAERAALQRGARRLFNSLIRRRRAGGGGSLGAFRQPPEPCRVAAVR